LNPLFSAHNRWRGKAGGPHQLVVTMEDLAGPHAVPIRIPRVAARLQESSVDMDAFLVHTQINVSTPEEVLFLVQQHQPKSGKNSRS